MNETQPLSDEDLAILKLESPRIAGHVAKVITIDPSPDGGVLGIDALRQHVAAGLERFPVMRCRLSDDAERPSWIEDERFDIRNQVSSWPASAPADRAGLFEITARLMETRLDRSRPLWAIHLVELEDGQSALVLLLHHSLVDGATAVRFCSEVLWEPLPAVAPPPSAPHPKTAGHAVNLRGWIRRELLPRAAETPLDSHPSTRRRVAATRTSLAVLKRIGAATPDGATVNDVALAVVAGGLRCWLERHGGSLHGLRVKVPVSLHDHHEHSNDLGNHDSFMFVDVGADEPDPAARLRKIAAQTRERKQRHDAQSLDAAMQELRHISQRAADALARWSVNPHVFTINVSNVPGPRTPVAVLGGPVRDLFTLAEIADRHALRVAAISLADELSFGLCADAEVVDDPERLIAGIEADLAALDGAAG